jgi:hypothetical protein
LKRHDLALIFSRSFRPPALERRKMRKITMLSAALVAAGCWALAASAGEIGGSRSTSNASSFESAMGSASLSALQAMRSNDTSFATAGGATGAALPTNDGISAMSAGLAALAAMRANDGRFTHEGGATGFGTIDGMSAMTANAMGSTTQSVLEPMRSNDAGFAPGTGITIGTGLGAADGMSAMNPATGERLGTETLNPPIKP